MKRAVIFDLDGTLWNATRTIYKALVEMQKEEGLLITSYELLCSLMGQPMNVIADQILPTLTEEKRSELMPSFYLREIECIKREGGLLFPHMVEVLTELKEKYPLLIVSNCQSGYIETFLETHGLGHLFADHLCWGDRKVHKGDNILALMERHGIDEAVYVGDTKGDEAAARRAEIPFIYVDFGFGQAEKPDYIMRDYRQLPELLQQIWDE